MKRSTLSLALLFLVAFNFIASAQNFDCSVGSTEQVPHKFTDFALFPNPVQIHNNVHLRTIVNLAREVVNGTYSLSVNHTTSRAEVFSITGLNLCTLSSSVRCPLKAGPNVITFDWFVPEIPAGNYLVRIEVQDTAGGVGCLTFDLTVEAAGNPWYRSWYEATLAGTAQYQTPKLEDRTLGDFIQVGKFVRNNATSGDSITDTDGEITDIVGSEDLIAPNTDPAPYLWGMYGHLTGFSHHFDTKGHILVLENWYYGHWFVGYNGPLGKYDSENPLFAGTFNLTFYWNHTTGLPDVNGTLMVERSFLPAWWPQPLLFNRLNPHTVYTDENGVLKVRGETHTCITAEVCDPLGALPPAQEAGYVFSDTDLGLTIGLILGFAFLVVLLVGLLLWMRHKKRHEEEDGVFSLSRKPEYGSALVVDDIVQESRGHTGPLLPRLDNRRGLQDLDLSDFSDLSMDEPQRGRGRKGGRGGRRRSTSGSRSSASLQRDSSRSRSRTPSGRRTHTRSRTRTSDSDSISPPSDDSMSRSRSRRRRSRSYSSSESEQENAYSGASDSSRSRSYVSSRSVRSASSASGSYTPSGSRSPSPAARSASPAARSASPAAAGGRSASPAARAPSASGSRSPSASRSQSQGPSRSASPSASGSPSPSQSRSPSPSRSPSRGTDDNSGSASGSESEGSNARN